MFEILFDFLKINLAVIWWLNTVVWMYRQSRAAVRGVPALRPTSGTLPQQEGWSGCRVSCLQPYIKLWPRRKTSISFRWKLRGEQTRPTSKYWLPTLNPHESVPGFRPLRQRNPDLSTVLYMYVLCNIQVYEASASGFKVWSCGPKGDARIYNVRACTAGKVDGKLWWFFRNIMLCTF